MKIYLYHKNKVNTFNLPETISGSYSFDVDEDEISKLINIEEKEGKWILYSTKDCKVLDGNSYVESTEIEKEKFYVITRNTNNYLIYVTDSNEKGMKAYGYNDNMNISIGTDNPTATYNCPYLNGLSIKIVNQNGQILLSHKSGNIYVNKKGIVGNYYIRTGDEVYLCGAKILFLCKMIIVFANENILNINLSSAGLYTCGLVNNEKIQNLEVKDKPLYNEEDYFTKAPRIRRQIEEKDIELSQPPQSNIQQELPLILTIGPMLTMGVSSSMMMSTAISQVSSGMADLKDAAPSIISASTMMLTTILWPIMTSKYNKRVNKKKEVDVKEKYEKYLAEKKVEIEAERKLQKEIIIENVISVEDCLKNLNNRKYNFWDKRIEQNDFLVARVGIGNELLKVKINNPEKGFSVDESDLKKQVDQMRIDYKYIDNVPIGYSFYENKTTAIMGELDKSHYFVNNLLLQLLTFYSYDELKIVVFTDEKKKHYWEYIKYLNHNMTNDSTFRFFASTEDTTDLLSDIMKQEINGRLDAVNNNKDSKGLLFKPYYLVIVDDLEIVRKTNIVNELTEVRQSIGFSLIILESKLSKLPSLCNNFINLGEKTSGILRNSYEQQEQLLFTDEINYRINMMEISRILANIPIDTSQENTEEEAELPEAISFLEMAKAGKVEQLNIMNRWNNNDSTATLKAEVGIGTDGKLMYLDLHEKAHGPHGLIAGMTGSGKSEFIITWILSLCMNFSPEDVAFILIDYKGGGLAFAFENQATGIRLPHLTGTITNLDKAEISRTLVSIDSEVKRRQKVFNEARDKMGESTIDIYKYQGFYHEGKLEEPLPHLFIVCDEFAELKAQQPDFMDNLISIARIGRSLGVHLILATQKPSGVVNDQIWSNTKFRVCLKVQDESDSKEMLKRPDAASLKQTGRFYLQVGFDEYFALGQSGWAGAKYYPSDTVQKTVDKSVNIIDDTGVSIKNIQAGGNEQKAKEAQGEQLAAVMNEIIKVAKDSNRFAKRLWLENIPEDITIEEIEKKYNITYKEDEFDVLVGEYDAPELQQQYPLIYNLLNDGNTEIVGTDSQENENLMTMILYNIMKHYKTSQVSFTVIDYGSQNFVKFEKSPYCAGVVTPGDNEKYASLMKLLTEELATRKKKLAESGKEYRTYIKDNPEDMPILLVIINGFESIYESNQNIYDILGELIRDSERYGIVYMFSTSTITSLPTRFKQLIPFSLCLRLKDSMDCAQQFNAREKKEIKDLFGRGICKNEVLHEFQTISICKDRTENNSKIIELIEETINKEYKRYIKVPVLPEQITIEEIKDKLKNPKKLVVGINRNDIKTMYLNFTDSYGKLILISNQKYAKYFLSSLVEEIKIMSQNVIVIDPSSQLLESKEKADIYINNDIDEKMEEVTTFVNNEENTNNTYVIINSLSKTFDKMNDETLIQTFIGENYSNEKLSIIIIDEAKKLFDYTYEDWFRRLDISEGLFLGVGVDEQSVLKVSNYSKEYSMKHPINYGYYVSEGNGSLIKLIEFEKAVEAEDDEE